MNGICITCMYDQFRWSGNFIYPNGVYSRYHLIFSRLVPVFLQKTCHQGNDWYVSFDNCRSMPNSLLSTIFRMVQSSFCCFAVHSLFCTQHCIGKHKWNINKLYCCLKFVFLSWNQAQKLIQTFPSSGIETRVCEIQTLNVIDDMIYVYLVQSLSCEVYHQ